jgi:hypothetical protein
MVSGGAINLLLDSSADANLPGSTGDNRDATLQHAIVARQPAAVRPRDLARLSQRHGTAMDPAASMVLP